MTINFPFGLKGLSVANNYNYASSNSHFFKVTCERCHFLSLHCKSGALRQIENVHGVNQDTPSVSFQMHYDFKTVLGDLLTTQIRQQFVEWKQYRFLKQICKLDMKARSSEQDCEIESHWKGCLNHLCAVHPRWSG